MSIPPTNQPNRPQTTAAVTAHLLFPAIVALWFAALLGIGSLVVPPEKLSALVSALGIPKLIHAAAPPLGFTARALLALVMAGVGGIVGLVIGLRVARRHKVGPQRKTDPTRGRKIVPTRTYAYDPADHLAGQEAQATPATAPAGRGPLRASEAFADIEPLTDTTEAGSQTFHADAGHADSRWPSDNHFAVLGAPAAERFEPADETGHDNFDDLLANAWEPEPEPFAPPAPFATLAERDELAAFESDTELQAHPISAQADVRRTLVEAPLGRLGTVQLVERLALAMAAAAEARNAAAIAPLADLDVQLRAAAPEPAALPSIAPANAADELLELDTLAQPADHDEPTPLVVVPFEASAVELVHAATEAQHIREPQHTHEPQRTREAWSAPDFVAPIPTAAAASPARPAIVDPIARGWDDEAGDDDDAPTIAPPRFLSARAPTTAARGEDPADTLDDADSEAAGENRYPSLLDIQPAARETIRIPAPQHAWASETQQAEPTVMFLNAAPRVDAPFAPPPASTLQSRRSMPFQSPIGQGSGGSNAGMPVTPPELPADPVDAEEADRALRAALATLQRMSGGR